MTDMSRDDQSPFDGLIIGAENIGKFIFKDEIELAETDEERRKAVRKARRQVYHLVETSQLPVFRLGSRIAARKSTLEAYVKRQEQMTSSNIKGFEIRAKE